MPSFLATYRTTKLLRRLAVTPASPSVEAFQSAWLGETIHAQNGIVLGASAVLGAGVAAALLRWE